MIGYLGLEVRRSLRDPRYVILALVAPVGFYLLFAGLDGQQMSGGLQVQVALMVSQSVFGAMWAVLQATGPRIAQDRTIGWLRQLRLLPVRSNSILAARLLAALVLEIPALLLVFLTAMLTHGVSLDAWRWAVLFVLLWLGTAPFAILGVAIGYALGAEVAFGVLYVLDLVMGALGGLWMPISVFPSGFQTVGKLLPSYQAADLGWHLVGGQAPDVSSVLILAGWAVAFAVLALFASGRLAPGR